MNIKQPRWKNTRGCHICNVKFAQNNNPGSSRDPEPFIFSYQLHTYSSFLNQDGYSSFKVVPELDISSWIFCSCLRRWAVWKEKEEAPNSKVRVGVEGDKKAQRLWTAGLIWWREVRLEEMRFSKGLTQELEAALWRISLRWPSSSTLSVNLKVSRSLLTAGILHFSHAFLSDLLYFIKKHHTCRQSYKRMTSLWICKIALAPYNPEYWLPNDSSSCVSKRRTEMEWMSARMSDKHQSC